MQLLARIRISLAIFMCGLVASGLTAFPLRAEANMLLRFLHEPWLEPVGLKLGLTAWMETIARALSETGERYPFLAYGTDWLAFAHLVIALAFIGPYREPVRNKWVVTFGLVACAAVLPLALIAGHIRHIPFAWRLLDCSFGVFGAIPLLYCRTLIMKLEQQGGVR
ncbi:MAG TPA: hypothetical protein VKX25_07445 [Bryobacteraceae bacterium]|jgi:hypothetical protein|nr:hypothetical protein [Bryobacteraceae bacterium]